MNWKKRLAIVISVLWTLVALALSALAAAQDDSVVLTFVLTMFPLVLAWGAWWVWAGFKGAAK